MELAHAHDRVIAKIIATVAVVGIAVAAGRCAMDQRVPYMMVDELVRTGLGKHFGREIRVHGFIAEDFSPVRNLERRFNLVSKGARIRVHLRGPLPDTARPQSEVVVHGRLVADDDGWLIEATELDARCTGGYRGKAPRADTIYR